MTSRSVAIHVLRAAMAHHVQKLGAAIAAPTDDIESAVLGWNDQVIALGNLVTVCGEIVDADRGARA